MSVYSTVLTEYEDLTGKLRRLETFILGEEYTSLPQRQRVLLSKQREMMHRYAMILQERLVLLGGEE